MSKILFVINTMGRAGAEKSMVEMMKVLNFTHYKIDLMVLINRGEMYKEVPPHVKICNKSPDHGSVLSIGARFVLIKTVLIAMIKRANIISNLPYLLGNMVRQLKLGRLKGDKLLWRIISNGAPRLKEKYDVAIAYLEGGSTYYVADHVKAAKKVSFIHVDYKNAGYLPYMDKGCYEKMDKIFVVSEDVATSYLSVYPQYKDKVSLFRNIINTKDIRRLSMEEGYKDGYSGFRLLSVGRLHPIKAYDIAIKAAVRLKEMGIDFRWYVLGDGLLKGELNKLIEKHGIRDCFILLGAVSNPYPYIKKCNLYVHCTRSEGRSMAIDEAMILGRAVLVSDCANKMGQITNMYNGLVISLDADKIANGIKKMINDTHLRERFERVNVRSNHDFKNQLDKIIDFIEE